MISPSFTTILEYTPYDNKCPSPFGIRKNDNEEERRFYSNNLFVDYPPSCEELKSLFSQYIEEMAIHTIVFTGPSGSGKTTFLRNFFKDNDNYICRYINLINTPSPIGNDETIRTALLEGIGQVFSPHVALLLDKTYREWRNDNPLDESVEFLGPELKRFLSFCESYAQEDSNLSLYGEINKFDFYKNNLTQLLSLYLVSNVILNKNDKRPFVFVFDNLDEVDKQYINTVLSDMISSSFSCAQRYCERVLDYNFTWYVTFVLSFRLENERFFKGSQSPERRLLHNTPCKLMEFSQQYQAKYSDILYARIRCFEEGGFNEKNEKISNNYNNIKNLLHSEDIFFRRFIKPLFSYDYRMFSHYAIKYSLQNRTISVPESLIRQDAGKDCRQGASGMLLFYSLAGMMRDDSSRFSSYVKEESSDDTCNIYRMSFTLLSNQSGWSHREEDLMELLENHDDFNEKTKQVNLFSFLQTIETWYPNEKTKLIPKVLEGLIGASANSFECPIILLGNSIDEYITSLGSKFTVSALASKVINDYLSNPQSLSSVNIQINPLCIVYSARVFIHFEYFNLISSQIIDGIEYEPKPLFQFTDFKKDRVNVNWCLSYTFETAKKIIDTADKHFCKKCKTENKGICGKECQRFIKKFKEEGFTFNNTIHATRIISAHIHYLENYRYYLWYNVGNKENHSDDEIEMQKMVIYQIKKYIEFYKNRVIRDDKYDDITKNWKNQYDNALSILNNQPQFYMVISLKIRDK